jgi:hypothetical protein
MDLEQTRGGEGKKGCHALAKPGSRTLPNGGECAFHIYMSETMTA